MQFHNAIITDKGETVKKTVLTSIVKTISG